MKTYSLLTSPCGYTICSEDLTIASLLYGITYIGIALCAIIFFTFLVVLVMTHADKVSAFVGKKITKYLKYLE